MNKPFGASLYNPSPDLSIKFLLPLFLLLQFIRCEGEKVPGALAWVTNAGDGSVSVIDLELLDVYTTLDLSESGSHGIAITPDLEKVYVGDMESGEIFVIDTGEMEVMKTIETGIKAHGVDITPVGRTVLISGSFSEEEETPGDMIALIDTDTDTVTEKIETESPSHITASPDGRYAYVANLLTHEVSRLDLETMQITGSVKVGPDEWEEETWGPNEATVSPDGSLICSADYDGQTVTLIDAETFTVVEVIDVETNPHGVAFTPDGSALWVVNTGSSDVAILDASTWDEIDRISLGEGNPLHLTMDEERRRVLASAGNNIYVIEISSKEIVSVIPVGDTPHEISIKR